VGSKEFSKMGEYCTSVNQEIEADVVSARYVFNFLTSILSPYLTGSPIVDSLLTQVSMPAKRSSSGKPEKPRTQKNTQHLVPTCLHRNIPARNSHGA
jgi:hypothetical protein